VDTPFKLLVIEREYSIPEIPNPWRHKVSLTTTEAKALIKDYSYVMRKMTVTRETILQMGVEFAPIREMVKISKNHYAIVTMMGDGQHSIHFNNHWSWSRDESEEDEYIRTLFIPMIFTEEVMKQVRIKVEE